MKKKRKRNKEVNATISELGIRFNYDKQNRSMQTSINNEEKKLGESLSNKTNVHMNGLFSIDSYNMTTILLSDGRLALHPTMDTKACVFMTIENCTNAKLISEVSTLTGQTNLDFKPFDHNQDVFDSYYEVQYCKESARISMVSCLVK